MAHSFEVGSRMLSTTNGVSRCCPINRPRRPKMCHSTIRCSHSVKLFVGIILRRRRTCLGAWGGIFNNIEVYNSTEAFSLCAWTYRQKTGCAQQPCDWSFSNMMSDRSNVACQYHLKRDSRMVLRGWRIRSEKEENNTNWK